MSTTLILSIAALLLGAVLGCLLMRAHMAPLLARADLAARDAEQLRADQAALQAQLTALTNERTQWATRAELQAEQLRRQAAVAEQQQQALRADHSKQLDELRSQYTQQTALLREQIANASQALLKQRADELSAANREQLGHIVGPLNESLKLMREAVEKSEREQGNALTRLQGFIEANNRQAGALGRQAERLARALTGENKVQGNFGELQLRSLLENMGLEPGLQFEEQSTLTDATGRPLRDDETARRMMPDVILHFPDHRDVVIDSKVSLTAFTDYMNATDDEARSDALKRHLASVRSHVNELAAKDYSRYVARGKGASIDFVVMYVGVEGALQLALANDHTLWKEAYDRKVIISGSQNMYMMLRVLEMTWRQVRQAENQEKIIGLANEVVSRVQLFYERFTAVSDQLNRTRKAFDDLSNCVSPGGKSITTAARKLVDLGASENPKRKLRLPKNREEDDDTPPAIGGE